MERTLSEGYKKIPRNNPDKDIVYTDETWLNQGHRTKKEWVDVESLKNLSRRQPGYNDLTIGCTKPSTGKIKEKSQTKR